MKKKKRFFDKLNIFNNYVYYLFILAIVLSALLLIFTFIKSDNQLDNIYYPNKVNPTLIKDVTLKSSDGKVEEVELPVKRSSDNSYSYKFTIDKDPNNLKQCINVIISYTFFRIKHGDEIIYESPIDSGGMVPSMATTFNIIEVPNKFLGKELEIEFVSNLDSDRGIMIPQIYVGTKNAITVYHYYNDMFKLTSAAILFITSIFMAIIGFFFMKIKHSSRNLFIAVLFTVVMSFYILFRTSIMYYYLDNYILAYFIQYTCFIILPLPLFLLFLNIFYENDYYDWRARSFEYFIIIIFINLITQWLLTIFGISEFVLMQKISQILLVVSGVYIFICIITLDRKRIQGRDYLVLSIMPLVILSVALIYGYYKTYSIPLVPLIIFSVVFFILSHFILALKKYILEFNIYIEEDFYSQLAYYDSLTQMSNRHDFEKNVKEILSKDIKFSNMYLIMLDMNNLKRINDNYGHKMGDLYLKRAGEVFSEIEKKYSKVKAYRYGGDEFIILAYDKKEKEIEKIVADIRKLSSEVEEECKYKLEFAIGYSLCMDQENFEIFTIKDIADKHMYADKNRDKEVIENGQ